MAHWGWWEDGWNMSPVARRGEIPEYSYFESKPRRLGHAHVARDNRVHCTVPVTLAELNGRIVNVMAPFPVVGLAGKLATRGSLKAAE